MVHDPSFHPQRVFHERHGAVELREVQKGNKGRNDSNYTNNKG